MPNTKPELGRYGVQSVARAARILNDVADAGARGLSTTEIAERLGVAKSTALSLARTLAADNLLRIVEPGPRYVLGLSLLRFGDLVSQQTSIGEVGRSTLQALSAATGMTARLASNEGGYPVFLDRVDGQGSIRFHAPLGQRESPHATAAGKAILATLREDDVLQILEEAGMARHTPRTLTEPDPFIRELERVRSDGYALDDEEEAEGVFCVGAAFFDHQGACAGALSVTALKVDIPVREVGQLGETVRQHADRLSAQLGGIRLGGDR